MDIKFAYTILYVEDVTKTIEFYKNSFGFEEKLLTPEKDYGEIKSGETTLAFASIELGNSNFNKGFIESNLNKKPFGIELAFTTTEVEKVMKIAIENGATLLEEKVTKYPNQWFNFYEFWNINNPSNNNCNYRSNKNCASSNIFYVSNFIVKIWMDKVCNFFGSSIYPFYAHNESDSDNLKHPLGS